MADFIKDGTGTGYLAKVSAENRLQTDCVSQDDATHISHMHEELYSWTTNHDVGADEYILCLKNTNSNKNLCIETIRIANDSATNFAVGFGTWNTVGGTSEIIGTNATANSANVAEAICYRTATDFTEDTGKMLQSLAGANTERVFRPEGKIVLGFNGILYIKTSAASTSNCSAVIWGFFKDFDI